MLSQIVHKFTFKTHARRIRPLETLDFFGYKLRMKPSDPFNTKFTYDYFQPDEYHFSLDSVLLAKTVAQLYREHPHLSDLKVLDLCAGTGVVGLELSYYLNQIEHLDFLEVQEIYLSFFEKNKELIAPLKNNFSFYLKSYDELIHNSHFHQKYDLILANPPYFFKGAGLLSPSDFKNRCRFFLDSSFENLFIAIGTSLQNKGQAFVLVRDGKEQNRNPVAEIQTILDKIEGRSFSVSLQEPIRGVLLVEINAK